MKIERETVFPEITDVSYYLIPNFLINYSPLPIQTLYKELKRKYKRALNINLQEFRSEAASLHFKKIEINKQISKIREAMAEQKRSVRKLTKRTRELSISSQVQTPPPPKIQSLSQAIEYKSPQRVQQPAVKRPRVSTNYIAADVFNKLWGDDAKDSPYGKDYKIEYYKPDSKNYRKPQVSEVSQMLSDKFGNEQVVISKILVKDPIPGNNFPFIEAQVMGQRGQVQNTWIRVPNDKRKFIFSK